jgi:hypothetical protein
MECVNHIETMPTGGRMDITEVLAGGNGGRKRAYNVIFVSDMICSKGYEHLESALLRLRQNQVFIHIYDQTDADPDYTGDLTLVDSELQSEQPLVMDRKMIEAYQKAYQSYYGRLRLHAERLGYYYNDISSEWDLTKQIQTLAPDALISI